jgi:hypothetical protein
MPLNINGTTGISGVDGSASAPALAGTDSNTGINFGTDTVNINTGGTTRATVQSNGRLSLTNNIIFPDKDAYIYSYKGGSDGQVRSGFELSGTNQTIRYFTSTNERMRIDIYGNILFNTTSESNITNGSVAAFQFLASGQGQSISTTSTGFKYQMRFYNPNGQVGYISTQNSATQFNTSSDYRLKENVTAISDGITRLKTLKPSRFNFKVNKDITVDGFLAHEVSSIVPEAITGTKDEVVTQAMIDAGDYKEGTLNDPIYQGIDQSKLVPLLTAALQEAVAKIEILETKVAALEAG